VGNQSFDDLLTEQPNPAAECIDALDAESILRLMNQEDRKAAEAVAAAIPTIARAVETIVNALRSGGRLFYIGAGTSGRLGVLDAAECPPTFNVPPRLVQGIIAGGPQALVRSIEAAEDDPKAGERDLLERNFTCADVLVGISASGRAPYVLGAVEAARRLGARTIGISCTPNSLLSQAVEIPIELLTGPEIIAGSTRLKAGTATKMVLNMLSTAAMIRLGHVFGNLMVNVQPNSAKLRDRALRIVARACGISRSEAAEWLAQANGEVKTAIIMARLNLSLDQARKRLERAGGRISEALANG